jgi:hypothetical protein
MNIWPVYDTIGEVNRQHFVIKNRQQVHDIDSRFVIINRQPVHDKISK